MSAAAGGKRETQNSQTGYDSQSGDQMRNIWSAADAAGRAGPSPLATGAGAYNTSQMAGGSQGLAALGGDSAAYNKLADPYQQNVVNAANNQWNQNDQQTMNAVNDRATLAGAFGGSRHGIATGVALGQNNLNRNSQISGLLSQGYSDTMQRAQGLAALGQNASAMNANLGMGGVGSPEAYRLMMLNQGWHGPTGTTSSGATAGTEAQTGFSIPFFGAKKAT